MNSYFSSRALEADQNLINQLSDTFKINKVFASILYSRGIKDAHSVNRFLNSGSHNFYDPYLLYNMDKATDLVRQHTIKNSNITIYGDYDADGICSVAILYLYFLTQGVNISWYIPEREEGYGINKDAVDYIIENHNPGLIISVDCGITAVEEVEYIKSLGVDILITDHHNCHSVLPDCIFVNPKVSPNYPFKELCGAGVAFKLVEALSGREESLKYVDIACIATIADSVELINENRDIVTEGLKKLNSSPRLGIQKLCEAASICTEINAYTVAFNIVPRINAAGRIGEAKRALALFFEENIEIIKNIAQELNIANTERQQICEKIILNANTLIAESDIVYRHIIAIIDDSGQAGVSGIVASKLCETYYRPSFVFCEDSNNTIKGSGRSIEGINIFDMLTSMSDLLTRFGGHAYAAGLTLKKENFEEFISRADKYLSEERYTKFFLKKQKYDYDITGLSLDDNFVKELEKFEPCGVGNTRPRFLYRAKSLKAQALAKHAKHLSFKVGDISVMAFNHGSLLDVFNSDTENSLLLEFKTNLFNGRVYSKGYLKDFICINSIENNYNDRVAVNIINRFVHENNAEKIYTEYSIGSLKDLLKEKVENFGTLLIASTEKTLQNFIAEFTEYNKLDVVFFDLNGRSNSTKIIFSPDSNAKFLGYRDIIFLDSPMSKEYLNYLKNFKNSIYIPDNSFDISGLHTLKFDLSREVFAQYYGIISKSLYRLNQPCDNLVFLNYIKSIFSDISFIQLNVCFMVFIDLNIISRNEEGFLVVNKKIKRPLEQSQLYNKLMNLINL